MEELEQNALEFFKGREYEKAAKLYLQLAVAHNQNENYLISAANCYDAAGDKKVALSLYKKALEINPQSLTAILNISTLLYELKKYEQSSQYAEQALAIKPDNFSALMNLGNIAYSRGEYDTALAYYEQMYALNKNSYNAIINIANTCYNKGQYLKALEYAQTAIDKRPTNAEPYIVAGNCYIELKRNEEGAACLKKAAEIAPNSDWLCTSISVLYQKAGNIRQSLHYAWKTLAIKGLQATADDHINFGYLLYEAEDGGEQELLEKYLERWTAAFAGNPVVDYAASALRHEENVNTTDLTYVKGVFDSFAPSFDEILGELNYRVPEYIAKMLKDSLKTNLFKKRRILDLGCGTGLCAEAVQALLGGTEFYGVDISENMLQEAGKKEIYKTLYAEDIMSFLENDTSSYHAVIAGDVLTYMGDLKALFREVSKAIKINGLFCFSVSKNIYNQNDYFLASSGRFAHSQSYIARLLKFCGLNVEQMEERVLRREGTKDVTGYIFLARKTIEVVFE